MPKYAKRVDINQKAIVEHLRAMGGSVFHLHTVGQGCPDILLGVNNQTYLVEIKANEKAKFTEAQIRFMAEWKGSPVVRINSVEEAIAFMQTMV